MPELPRGAACGQLPLQDRVRDLSPKVAHSWPAVSSATTFHDRLGRFLRAAHHGQCGVQGSQGGAQDGQGDTSPKVAHSLLSPLLQHSTIVLVDFFMLLRVLVGRITPLRLLRLLEHCVDGLYMAISVQGQKKFFFHPFE